MTQNLFPAGKAVTAIAAFIAFTSTQTIAQDVGAPSDPVADTIVETPTSADPLTAEPVASEAPVATDAAVPPAPKPKVETTKTAVKPAEASAPGSTARKTSATAPAAASPAAPAPTALPTLAASAAPSAAVAPPPPAEAAAPPAAIAQPATIGRGTFDALVPDLMRDDMVIPAAAAAALGLLALTGAGIAMRRRRRRREDEEFEARQQFLDMAEAEPPVLELGRADRAGPGPSIARPLAPVHDPGPTKRAPAVAAPGQSVMSAGAPSHRGSVGARAAFPDRGNWESRSDANFLFSRPRNPVKDPVEES
jgi:hypothetical protein